MNAHKHKDVHAEDKNGKTPLHLAIFKNKVSAVELLSQKGAKVDAKIPFYGAIQYYSTGIVKALIDVGVDVKAKDEQGYTPLHWPIFENKKDVVKLVLKASINCLSNESILSSNKVDARRIILG
uniref:ANK_REP_REGION domain-containing protein n=1 Tax=Glossina pallidipes TaxID=7398 RepID=A0A1B0ABX1_GLOPL